MYIYVYIRKENKTRDARNLMEYDMFKAGRTYLEYTVVLQDRTNNDYSRFNKGVNDME